VVSTFLLSFVEDDDGNEFWLGNLIFKQSESVPETMTDLNDVFFVTRELDVTNVDFSWERHLVDFDVADYACLLVEFEFVHACTVSVFELTTNFDKILSKKTCIDDAVIVLILDIDR